VLKSITLASIDAVMVLDKIPMDSREFEMRIMTLQGYVNHLWKLYLVVLKTPKEKKGMK